MSIASPTRYTADDLLALPDGKSYELVDGQLVELSMGMESSWIAGEVFVRLCESVRGKDLGWVLPEGTGYQCFPNDREQVRKPDTSVVLKARLPQGPVKGFCRIAPDLVVEVISPNDIAWEVDVKVEEWLAAGVPLVWVVLPATHAVVVHQGDQIHRLTGEDELTAEPLIPGFCCRVKDLFPIVAQS